jgi:hypothetical protein
MQRRRSGGVQRESCVIIDCSHEHEHPLASIPLALEDFEAPLTNATEPAAPHYEALDSEQITAPGANAGVGAAAALSAAVGTASAVGAGTTSASAFASTTTTTSSSALPGVVGATGSAAPSRALNPALARGSGRAVGIAKRPRVGSSASASGTTARKQQRTVGLGLQVLLVALVGRYC